MHDLQICCAACMPAVAITSRQSRSSTIERCSLWYVRITDQMTLRCDHSGDFHKCCRSPDICHCYTVNSDRSGHLNTWAARHRIELILSLSVCKANHHMSLREETNAQGTLSRWACLGQKCSSDWRVHVKHQARHHCTESRHYGECLAKSGSIRPDHYVHLLFLRKEHRTWGVWTCL